MKIFAIVLIVFISESRFSSESSLEELEEAVFQGNCNRENLCSQLCYELHDGMFECACNVGFELMEDGYSCSKTKNISQLSAAATTVTKSSLTSAAATDSSLKETPQSQSDEDYNSSDIFYQKGVLFSAKLDDKDNYYEANSSSSIVDTLPDNQTPRELTSFEYRNESNEISFMVETSNNNFISIPKFYSTSHLAFHPLKGANLVTEIAVEFKPEDVNGTILFSGERDDLSGDFMLVTLNDGYIEFLFNCGSGTGKIRSSDKVILNEWNSLTIYRYKWEGWIELNERRRKRGRSTGIFSRITFRSLLYLGGMANETRESMTQKNIHTDKGFTGCIRKFIINGKSYVRMETSNFTRPAILSSADISECLNDECSYVKCLHGGRCQKNIIGYTCQCPLGWSGKFCGDKVDLQTPYFNGTSYLRYSALDESAIIWLEIKLVIKPKSLDGLLLYSGQNDFGDFISLHLNFGYVEFNFDLGSGSTSVRSRYPISLDEWHTIRVSRTARLAVLKVDSQSEAMNVSPNGFWHLSLPYSLFLGGTSKLHSLPSNLQDLGSFSGCIQELSINNRNVDLINDALGGLQIANCDDDKTCTNSSLLVTESTETTIATQTTPIIENNEIFDKNNDKKNQKYAFDVIDIDNHDHNDSKAELQQIIDNKVNTEMIDDDDNDDNDDGVVRSYENNSNVNSLDYINKKVDDSHKKIVRVSLHKNEQQQLHHSNDKLKELCFVGDIQNYTFYGFNKSIKYEKMYQQINVNIRFKTFDNNGLLLLIYQKLEGVEDIFLSLSVENGYMRLKYNYKNAYIDIKHDINNVNDGLWHRVHASRKKSRGSLTIDNLKSISYRSRMRKFAINGTPGIYIGGSFYTRKIPRHFNGCISDFSISTGNEQHHLDLHNNNFRTKESNVNLYEVDGSSS